MHKIIGNSTYEDMAYIHFSSDAVPHLILLLVYILCGSQPDQMICQNVDATQSAVFIKGNIIISLSNGFIFIDTVINWNLYFS